MRQTPEYQLPFEDGDDQPGITLTGGEFNTEPVLAEQVEAALGGLAQDIADTNLAVADLGRGWRPITSGLHEGPPPFIIDVTNGGEFPPGTFRMLRWTANGNMVGSAGDVTLRINNDSTASLHENSWMRETYDAGAAAASGQGAGTVWRVGRFGTLLAASSLICTIMGTHASTRQTFFSIGASMGNAASTSTAWRSNGRLASSLGPVTSLRIGSFDTQSDFNQIAWDLEGFIR